MREEEIREQMEELQRMGKIFDKVFQIFQYSAFAAAVGYYAHAQNLKITTLIILLGPIILLWGFYVLHSLDWFRFIWRLRKFMKMKKWDSIIFTALLCIFYGWLILCAGYIFLFFKA